MYPSIQLNNVLYLSVVKDKLDSLQDEDFKSLYRVEKNCFLQCLEFFLKNIQVKFNGRILKQKQGLSIGACISPLCLNLIMDHLEGIVNEEFKDVILLYSRFADDIFVAMRKEDWAKLESIVQRFTQLQDSIQLTIEQEKDNCLQCLDLKCFIKGEKRIRMEI